MTHSITQVPENLANTLVTYEELAAAEAFASASKSPATLRAYRSAWTAFTSWCEQRGALALPADPNLVAVYLSSLACGGRKVPTVEKHLAAIAEAHRLRRMTPPSADPAVVTVMKGLRRTVGVAKTGKHPLVIQDLRRVMAAIPDDLLGIRDGALIITGFTGALRRSELVALNVEDLRFQEEGTVITIRRSKADQEGKGEHVGLPFGSRIETCPVRAIKKWLSITGIESGPLFRPIGRGGHPGDGRLSGESVGLAVKRAVARVGLNPRKYGAHSLRSGLVTSAATAGVDSVQLSRHTRHASLAVLRDYIRPATVFLNNPAAEVGL